MQSDPIPEERLEESPAICPHCGHKLSLQDEGSEQYLEMFFGRLNYARYPDKRTSEGSRSWMHAWRCCG